MKKITALLLIFAMIFSFTACGEKDTGSSSGNGSAWYEANDKKEAEYELRDEYNLSHYTLTFDNGTVKREIYAGIDNYIVQTGTYKKEKNFVKCDINGFEVVYRLFEDGIVNITEDVYPADLSLLKNEKNILVYEDLKNADLSSVDGPVIFRPDSRPYLVLNGTVFMQFDLGSYNGSSIERIEIEPFRKDRDFDGVWFDSYLESATNRFATYAEYEEIYKEELEISLKMMDYILTNKDTNPLCVSAYYDFTSSSRGSGCLGYTFSQTLENIGALYWTMGKTGQAKDAFRSIPKFDEYIKDKYSREVELNEYNMIIKEPTFSNTSTYVTDEKGLVIQSDDRGKVTEFRYDSDGRLQYKWVYRDVAYKYEYSDGKIAVHSVFFDRYGTPLQDNFVYALSDGKRGAELEASERVTEIPSWVSEIPAGF